MALEDVVDRYKGEPCPKALWLRFLLAWLFHETGADPANKWLFTSFWTAVTTPIDESSHLVSSFARNTAMEAALNGISRALGWERTVSFMHEMRDRRRSIADRRSRP